VSKARHNGETCGFERIIGVEKEKKKERRKTSSPSGKKIMKNGLYCLQCNVELEGAKKKYCSAFCQGKHKPNIHKNGKPWNYGLTKVAKDSFPNKRLVEIDNERVRKLSEYLKEGGSPLANKEIHARGVDTRRSRNNGEYFSAEVLEKIRNNNGNKIRLENMPNEEKKALGDCLSQKRKEWWAQLNSEQRSEMYRKIFARREPSGPENVFQVNYVDKYNLPFEYTGNIKEKKIDIGGKIPDFIDYEEKRIIEIFGNCYHEESEYQERIDYFNQLGYDCIIIWASELKNKELVLSKIEKFM